MQDHRKFLSVIPLECQFAGDPGSGCIISIDITYFSKWSRSVVHAYIPVAVDPERVSAQSQVQAVSLFQHERLSDIPHQCHRRPEMFQVTGYRRTARLLPTLFTPGIKRG